MSCPCQSRAIAGYDDASKTYKPPFPGAWFWTYSWPAGNTKTVQSGKDTIPAMTAANETNRAKWEAGCKAGTFPGNMIQQCEAAKHMPSMAGYAAIGGGVLVLAGLAYLALKA